MGALVSKGFIWCLFGEAQVSPPLLVINTHLQAAGKAETQVAQLDELREFIAAEKERRGEDLRVLIAGDFNIEIEDIDIGRHLALDKMSDFRPTFPAEAENIDHVFTDLGVESKTCHLFQSIISDHRALFMEMNLADAHASQV